MIFFKEDTDDWYQYWALSIFISYVTLSLLLHFDKGQNLCFIIQVLLLLYTYNNSELFRAVFKNKFNLVWLLLIFYHWINSGIQNVPYEYNYIDVFIPLFRCYFLLVWTCYLAIKDMNKTFRFMLIGYLVFIVLAALDAIGRMGYDFSSMESDKDRLTGGIHLTVMGAMSGLTIFVVALLRHYSKYSLQKILPLLVVPLIVVIMAASRNGLLIAFAGLFCVFLTDFFSMQKSVKNLGTVFFFAVVVCFVVYYILQETYVGERLLSTKEQSEAEGGELDYKTGTILDYLGDRTWYYALGFSNFLEHPIFGIGFSNFKYYNNAPFIMHPEYMIQIAEGGLVAIFFFFYFILSVFFNLVKLFFLKRSEISFILLIFMLMTLMACFSTILCYDLQYWPLLGVCVAFIMKNEEHINYVTEKTFWGLLLYSSLNNKINELFKKNQV